MRLALVLGALAGIAACSAETGGARAQDLGIAMLAPVVRPLPPVGQTLRPGIGAADPARVLVIGDSLSQGFGALMIQQAAARDLPVSVANRGQPSTGLARADYYDWPANFERMAETLRPDIVVAHFGANDMQAILAPEGRTALGAEDWDEAYRVQIRKILETAARYGIVLYWIGPGPDGNTNLNRHLARINPLFEEEAARAGAVYFPVTPFTTPPGGAFARTVEVEGETISMRTADGSHFTGRGYQLVADRLFDAMIARFPALGPSVPDDGTAILAFALQ